MLLKDTLAAGCTTLPQWIYFLHRITTFSHHIFLKTIEKGVCNRPNISMERSDAPVSFCGHPYLCVFILFFSRVSDKRWSVSVVREKNVVVCVEAGGCEDRWMMDTLRQEV